MPDTNWLNDEAISQRHAGSYSASSRDATNEPLIILIITCWHIRHMITTTSTIQDFERP